MRSITHSSFGDPADVLKLIDVPLPEPAKGEVRIRTTLAVIHNHDLLTVQGAYGSLPMLPTIGGSEAVGTIDAVGDGIDPARIGQRVTVSGVRGTWAEYFIAPVAQIVLLPGQIDDETGAQLTAMPLSALGVLDFSGLRTGDWLIQNAANGAVGRAVAVFAKRRGINLVNLVRRADSIPELTAAGIDHIVATEQGDWRDKVNAIVGSGTLSAAIDSIGGSSSDDLLSVLASEGLLISFGAMSRSPVQLNADALIFKQVTVKGYWIVKVLEKMSQSALQSLMDELVATAASGALHLPVDSIHDLADFATAIAAARKTGRSGKLMLRTA